MDMTTDKALTLNWSIIPAKGDKKPWLSSWDEYQQTRADAARVAVWQETYDPAAWAVVTGTISGIVVLDFDGFAGLHLLDTLGLDPHVLTGRGGMHVYVKHPGFLVKTLNGGTHRLLGDQFPGLDTRADGGYAVFCGRNTYGPYTWLREPDLYDYSVLPDALQQLIRKQ